MITYTTILPKNYIDTDIESAIYLYDSAFAPKLSERINLKALIEKISIKAVNIIVKDDIKIIGICSFYCNSLEFSYLTIIAVDVNYRRQRIGKELISRMIDFCLNNDSLGIRLETHSNLQLITFYSSFGFTVKKKFLNEQNQEKLYLILDFKHHSICHFDYEESPIEKFSNFGSNFSLFIKRDDLFQKVYGGNKARKLQYILWKAKNDGYDSVVTAGDINSNHNRATALMCATLEMKVKLIVHNDYPENEKFSHNMFLSRISGAEIIYCAKKNVAETMNLAMQDFQKLGGKPFYIYGGGHCLEGAYAFYDAVKNLKNQIFFSPDYIFFASGTGTTHAGIHVACKRYFPKTNVIGISIARNKERGVSEIYKSIKELEKFLSINNKTVIDDINLIDAYVGAGYEMSNSEEISLIKKMALKGLILDPTYSGKAFYGMQQIIEKNCNAFFGKNIIFWNTGGIFNLLSHKELFL